MGQKPLLREFSKCSRCIAFWLAAPVLLTEGLVYFLALGYVGGTLYLIVEKYWSCDSCKTEDVSNWKVV